MSCSGKAPPAATRVHSLSRRPCTHNTGRGRGLLCRHWLEDQRPLSFGKRRCLCVCGCARPALLSEPEFGGAAKMGVWRVLCVPLVPGARSLSCAAVCRAGSQWRLGLGMAKSGTEYGPLTDLPDWSFADGRPAPRLKGQIRRRQEGEEMALMFLRAENPNSQRYDV
uniref:large ribosomal subunit protein mL52 n=1 Tax=Pristiophorus japonicus TaxID=55135 RepID=UPI00398F85C7